MRRLSVHRESWLARTPFRTTGHTVERFEAVIVTLEQHGRYGRGEGLPVHYLGETLDSVEQQIAGVRAALCDGVDRQALLDLMSPGAARNAADAALWDLEAQLSGVSAWQRAGVVAQPVRTVFTIGLRDTPQEMAAAAAAAAGMGLLKIKLDGDRPVERVAAIRAARPDAQLVVDANQGFTFEQLVEVAPRLAELGVTMIEQPLPRGSDDALLDYRAPLPLCADESCQHLGELEAAAARYQMINIKLDKAGGLTHALELEAAARACELGLMVGCMGGTSLAMAPAHVLAQRCRYVDIDGPLLLRQDRLDGLVYDAGMVSLPAAPTWGVPAAG